MVAGWAGFNLLALVAMVIVAVVVIILSVVTVGLTHGGESPASTVGGVVGGTLGFLGTLLIEVSVVGALFRMLLRAGPPGFFYLRIGRDELRLLATWLSVLVTMVLAGFLVVGAGVAASRAGVWAVVSTYVLGAGLLVWLLTRLSLAAPAGFAERRFGLASAWRLSRGRVWALLGMNVLATCLLALLAVVAWFALFTVMAVAGGFHDLGLMTLSSPDALKEHPVRYIVQLVAELAFAPVLWVISQAPLAAAYEAFTAPPADAAPPS